MTIEFTLCWSEETTDEDHYVCEEHRVPVRIEALTVGEAFRQFAKRFEQGEPIGFLRATRIEVDLG